MDKPVQPADTKKSHLIGTIYDKILNAGKSIGMVMIFLTCIGICVHVFMRYFLDFPINWFIDIATLFLFFITFLGAAWLLREDGHVSLDFLFHAIGPKKYNRVQIVTNVICGLACLFIAYYGVKETLLAIDLEVVVDMPLAPPKWIVLIFIPLGFLMLAIEFLRKVFKCFKESKENQLDCS